MRKLLLAILLTLLLAFTGCGFPGEPMLDDAYPRDMYFTEGYRIILEGDSRVWLEFRPDLDFESVRANGVPTWVQQGAFGGFSLPIWDAGANINEQMNLEVCVPDRWDGTSGTHVHIDCWIDTAQDAANDAFNLQVSYEHYESGVDIVPATFTNVEVETTTGIAVQFQSYQVSLTIPAGDMLADDVLGFRLRRIDVAVGNEIDGEIVINHVGVIFNCDKLGNPDPY